MNKSQEILNILDEGKNYLISEEDLIKLKKEIKLFKKRIDKASLNSPGGKNLISSFIMVMEDIIRRELNSARIVSKAFSGYVHGLEFEDPDEESEGD